VTTFWRKLDVTDPADGEAAVAAAVDRFGRIDVLVNNAGNFNAGFFEELSPEEFRAQIETTFFGPVNVTRAVLPLMRAQRSGLVVTISSTAGLEGGEFTSAYATSKFGVEGWMESLAPEVAPFGIRTMLVEPGFFRTELLTPESTKYAASSIEDYAERTEQTVTAWKAMNGQQGGDPAKLADALVHLAGLEEPPLRFAAGADAVAALEKGQQPPRPCQRLPRPVPQLGPRFGLSHVQLSTICLWNQARRQRSDRSRAGPAVGSNLDPAPMGCGSSPLPPTCPCTPTTGHR
jgi:NAD(P)-dependent dehydrogenase (short-subunit alcohol dehydrogenase family)